MKFLAFDTETWLIQPGLVAPRMVCASFAWADGECTSLRNRPEGLEFLRRCLDDPSLYIIGHNVAFDVAVTCEADLSLVPLWLAAYEAGRVRDTQIRQRLIDCAAGTLEHYTQRRGYHLAALVKRHLGVDISASKAGDDIWRLRYHELDGVPLRRWPEEALQYAEDDAVHTLAVHNAQWERSGSLPFELRDRGIVNEVEQTRYALALHLATTWGLRTDLAAVAELRAGLEDEIAGVDEMMKREGLMRPRGSMDQKKLRARVSDAYGGAPPETEKGNIKTDSDTLLASGDPVLKRLGESSKPKHHLRNFVAALEAGRVNPRYYAVKETGRISSAGPNIQNFPREGGFRECFQARPGRAFLGADYSQIELCALAQVCLDLLGWSQMAEAIRAGKDLHLVMAALMLGQPYESLDKKTHKEPRQRAKAANFGFPGGLGAASFVEYARSYELEIDEDEARDIKADWLEAWPEMREYFAYIGRLVGPDRGDVIQLRSRRKRGGCWFTQACNSFFQGLAADGMGAAAWLVARECYGVPSSPIYGWRTVAVVHDELLLEGPEDGVAEASERLVELMVEGMASYIPDIPITVEPAASRRWAKDAETVRDAAGRLLVWQGKDAQGVHG